MAGNDLCDFTKRGVLCAVKYGWMLGATGLFLVQYKRVSEKYNPFTVAFITTLIGGIMEAMDWFMNGMIKEELYALIPIVLLTWSTTVIFFSTNQKLYVAHTG